MPTSDFGDRYKRECHRVKIVYKEKINSLSEATRFDRLRQKNLETETDQRLDSRSMQSSTGEKADVILSGATRGHCGSITNVPNSDGEKYEGERFKRPIRMAES